MKKTKLFGLALIAAMTSFSACTNDAEEVLTQESEIKLTSEITPSRVADSELQSTQIVAGRKIGITVDGAKGEHKNVPWKAEANGALTNTTNNTLYWGNGNVSIYAYHPYIENWGTNEMQTFSVQTDQSSDEGYLNSDLLVGGRMNVSHTESAVNLVFVHVLSKISITLTSSDIDNINGAEVYICGTDVDLAFNPFLFFEGSFIENESNINIQEIKVGEITEDSKTVSAIIVPQTIQSNSKFIRIELNDKNYYFILDRQIKFESHYAYNLALNLKNKQEIIELKGFTARLENWYTPQDFFFDGNYNAGESDGITDIYNGKAGNLSTIVNEDECFSHLKLSGSINENDLKYIKDNLTLSYLDLSDASYSSNSLTSSPIDYLYYSLSYLAFPKNIETIGSDNEEAPYGLEVIVIPSNVKSIYLSFTDYLKEIHCKATTPPNLDSYCWTDDERDFSHLKVYVPKGSKSEYEATEIWKDFEIIEE